VQWILSSCAPKITTLQEAMRAKPDLKLYILTDALRGTRESPNPSCATLLAPLITEFGSDRVELRMYHTPNLTGLRKKHIPRRINEGWGLQHMKLYGFDDEILLSGFVDPGLLECDVQTAHFRFRANLSNDYFTNRQDRYHLFSSKEITHYFWELYNGVASLSFEVKPSQATADGFELTWPAANPAPSPLESPDRFVIRATSVLRQLIAPREASDNKVTLPARMDTTVYILAQLSQLLKPDTSTELPAITNILKTLRQPQFAKSSWTFTAGYFNPAPSLTKLLIQSASTNNVVITAAPEANGFYKSPGVSGLLPEAYTYLAHRFLKAVQQHQRGSEIALKEWRRGTVGQPDGWTYHAKGLWITLPGEPGPSLALVGSSNYTKRSYSLDLEANALILTENESLQKRLGEEQQWLQEHAVAVNRDDFARTDRRVSFRARVAMWIVSLVGGAL
jgi:CDP-diacylglycerol---glycerol-3-phosphate 3-phosphatidyltransferase